MLHLDGDAIVEQPTGQRENYIPLHTMDIVEYLALYPSLSGDQVAEFRRIAALILALMHHAYRRRHEELTYTYSPLDPDRDRVLRSVPTAEERDRLCSEVFEHVRAALVRANYHRLSQADIEQAMRAASQWGVRMRVNFDMLTHLDVYARGFVIGKRDFRSWRNWFRTQSVEVPLYQRLVVIFRTKEALVSDQFDSRRVYLRMFKNIPQQDIDMMLPATGIQMTWLDHSRIVVPSLYAAAMALWRFLRNVVLLAFFGVFKTIGMVVLIIFAVGFGIKSMFTYRTNTKRRYMLNMAQSLYYQNLDNNAGVLLRLLEEGEQQESGEAILAYFAAAVLLRDQPQFSLPELDAACETLLKTVTNIEIDFDIDRTAATLSKLGLLQSAGEAWRASPFPIACDTLETTWDSRFTGSAEPAAQT